MQGFVVKIIIIIIILKLKVVYFPNSAPSTNLSVLGDTTGKDLRKYY